VGARLQDRFSGEVDTLWSDDGMVFRVPYAGAPLDGEAATGAPRADGGDLTALLLPSAQEIEDLVVRSIAGTSLFAARFRECAARALLLPRRHPTQRTPLWAQRKRAADLLSVASQHGSFPIILETYREVLRDVFDLPALVETLRRIEQRRIRVTTVDVQTPSPFAASLLFSYVANFIYDGDAPLAERRAQVLGIDHAQLRQLLGEVELRELLDPEAIDEHERSLQRLIATERGPAVRSEDALHDLLLSIGDLSQSEIAARARSEKEARAFTKELERARRIAPVKIGSERRFIAAEDAGRYRDALGVVPPSGLPRAFLEPQPDPLAELVARYARTHGPFVVESVASRFSIGVGTARAALERLEARGRVLSGEFLRGGQSREWCDAEVLRVLRRKSLSRLRKEAEAVDEATYARFLPAWHGIVAESARAPEALPSRPYATATIDLLLAAIERLQGAPIPASILETEVLPARVPGYRPSDLDALCATGDVVWAGIEPLGTGDGRIALYLAEHEPLLARVPAQEPPAEGAQPDLGTRIRAVLQRRGAVFFAEIARELGGFPGEILDALWSLVWAGEVTNDTLAPLRAHVRAGPAATRPRRPGRPVAGGLAARGVFAGPPGSEGRWSLRVSRWARVPTETERRTALAHALLDRYGVLTREAAQAEGISGGFGAVYEVLKAMEEAGRIRRGYFVEGRGAAQFALPGAVDRLRSFRIEGRGQGAEEDAPTAVVLAANDPASPFGALLPWPSASADARPQRAAGALVIIHEGRLVGYVGRTEQSLSTFLPEDEPRRGAAVRALSRALSSLVDEGRRRAIFIARIDGVAAADSPLADALASEGFRAGVRGVHRGARPRQPTVPSGGLIGSTSRSRGGKSTGRS
jgi:ATP-dependent Lhr-like helicase